MPTLTRPLAELASNLVEVMFFQNIQMMDDIQKLRSLSHHRQKPSNFHKPHFVSSSSSFRTLSTVNYHHQRASSGQP